MLFNEENIVIRKEKVIGKLEFQSGLKVAFLGTLYLTNCRLILINVNESYKKFNFALHLNLISQVSFNRISQNQTIEGKFQRFGNLMPCDGSFLFGMKRINPELIQYLSDLIEKIRSAPLRIIQAFVNPRDPDVLIMQDLNPNETLSNRLS